MGGREGARRAVLTHCGEGHHGRKRYGAVVTTLPYNGGLAIIVSLGSVCDNVFPIIGRDGVRQTPGQTPYDCVGCET
jgi:hypothetical protein